MAHNNAWANHRLLSACLALDVAAFHAPRVELLSPLAATLNHILVVDWFYVDALEGGWLGSAAFADEIPCRTPAALHAAQRAVDDRLIAVCDALTRRRRWTARCASIAASACRSSGATGCCCISSNTRSTTAARPTPCCRDHGRRAAAARRVLLRRRGAAAAPPNSPQLGWTEERVWGP